MVQLVTIFAPISKISLYNIYKNHYIFIFVHWFSSFYYFLVIIKCTEILSHDINMHFSLEIEPFWHKKCINAIMGCVSLKIFFEQNLQTSANCFYIPFAVSKLAKRVLSAHPHKLWRTSHENLDNFWEKWILREVIGDFKCYQPISGRFRSMALQGAAFANQLIPWLSNEFAWIINNK